MARMFEVPTACIRTPLSSVILSRGRRPSSKDPEGYGLTSIAPALFYLDSSLAGIRGWKLTLDLCRSKHSRGSWSLRFAARYLCQAKDTTPCGRSEVVTF